MSCIVLIAVALMFNVSYLTGLLQSSGQRQTAQAARDRQGQVLQPTGRGEDQGSGGSLRADGIMLLSLCFFTNKLCKWEQRVCHV